MTYRVRVINRSVDLLQLEDAWTTLLRQCGGATVFASYQWNATWWRHFHGNHRLYVITVWEDNGTLVGLAPLMLGRLGPLWRLQFIGTGLSDYGDFLVHPLCQPEVLGTMLSFLRARRRFWDLGDLSEVPAHSSLPGYLRSQVLPGLRSTLIEQTACPFVDLPRSWEDYVAHLARKRRYYVSSFPRKFIKEHEGVVEVLGDEPCEKTLEDAVAIFHNLHMKRWAERPEEISEEHRSAAFLPFLQEVCASMAEQGWLRLVSLRAGETTVAASLNFLLHGRWNAYMKGFDPAWSSARPGTVLDSFRIKRAIDEGAAEFDFGRGDEPYKSGYGLHVEKNTRVLLGTNTPLSLFAYNLALLRIAYRKRTGQEKQITRPTEE